MSLTLPVVIRETTIVTAAKVGAGDVQAIPMGISAVSSAELERLGTSTLYHAVALAPSVTLSQNSGRFGQLTIRGFSTHLVNAGSDPSSAMYLDAVYLAGRRWHSCKFDLDRVEVLRCPQGTLYPSALSTMPYEGCAAGAESGSFASTVSVIAGPMTRWTRPA